jgi:hypothetical protein
MRRIETEGRNITNLYRFYEEIIPKLTKDLDWEVGHSLDALNDLLYGGFGVHAPNEKILIILHDTHLVKVALGYAETREYYRMKVQQPMVNRAMFEEKLALAEAEKGRTLFEVVLEVFIDHPNVELWLK